ncbi:2-hydroxyacid dehydrogenase [Bdellovibrio bacteriovorus]|uniref:2-hydroxyacid dehydrogenase n=1 Tax=Bdellovibrio TaxID=958 RepID=UPI0035A900C3
MKIVFFDMHSFEKAAFLEANKGFNLDLEFLEAHLHPKTAILARGAEAVCAFVNDKIDDECILILKDLGVRHIALRSAGFNNVDIVSAKRNGIVVSRVPGYSPYAVAEFATGLLLTLNRKIHRAYSRVRELNFSLDGLVGFDLHGKTVGVLGAGRIGKIFSLIMASYGCKVLVCDPKKDSELELHPGISYVDHASLCRESDIISLHVPLTPETYHIIDSKMIATMKNGVFIINTGRGSLIDTKALIEGLKKEKIGGAALDVYEEEENIFFQDLSGKILQDDILARLLTFPNVVVTSHQAFLTKEALQNIANSTLRSIYEFKENGTLSKEETVC